MNIFHAHERAWICLFLVIAIFCVYGQVTDDEFINYDDDAYVYENAHVRAGLTSESISWAFTTTHMGNWHPLTWLSHMMDAEIFGMNPGRHHLHNVLFHIANTLLLLFVLLRMTNALWPSAVVAALFALHPLHAESVAWISERKDMLSTFFWMLTLWAYIRYAEKPGIARYLPVFLFLGLGLMAKSMLVTLPFVLILLDYWPLGRLKPDAGVRNSRFLSLFLEKTPLIALSVIFSGIALFAQHSDQAVRSLESFPLKARIINAVLAYAIYVRKMVWPSDLAIFYPSAPELFPWWQIAGAFLFLVIISLGVLRFARQRPYLAVGWLWYLGTLVPVIGLVQVGSQAMADRYTYVPLIGLFIMTVWGLADFLEKQSRAKTIMIPISSAVIFIFMAVTWLQVQYWQNSITLFEHALRVTQHNVLAHTNLGLALSHQGRRDEAMVHYSAALRLSPNNATILNNMGVSMLYKGKIQEAAEYFEKALQSQPDHHLASANLAALKKIQKKRDKAFAEIRESLRADPDNPVLYYKLGMLYRKCSEIDKAIAQYEKALSLQPDFIEAIRELAMAHAVRGKYDHAISFFKRILDIQPENLHAPYYLAGIHARQRRTEESVKWLRRAIENGYNDWEMLRKDANLENIRETFYYQKIMNKITVQDKNL